MNLLDVKFKEKFSSMPYAKTGCGGSIPLMISVVKFSDFDDMIKSANLSLKHVCRDYNATKNGLKTQDAVDANRFFHLKHAILDYSACYDYCLLIVFFAFEFCGKITSHQEYKKALRECRYRNTNSDCKTLAIYDALKVMSLDDTYAAELLNRLDLLMHERDKLAKWANAIKHRGNIYHQGLEPILPEIAYTTSMFYYNENGDIRFTDGKITSLSDIIIPQIVSNEQGIVELIKHNKTLYEFANWLYGFIGFAEIETDRNVSIAFRDIRPFVYTRP